MRLTRFAMKLFKLCSLFFCAIDAFFVILLPLLNFKSKAIKLLGLEPLNIFDTSGYKSMAV